MLGLVVGFEDCVGMAEWEEANRRKVGVWGQKTAEAFGHKSKGFRYGGNVFLLICAYAQFPFGRYERDNGFILLWDNAETIRPFADASRQTKLRRKCRRSSCWCLRGD